MLKYIGRRFVKLKGFLMVHSFMGACAPGLRMWGCTDVLSRTFPLQQLSLCFMFFFFYVLCVFENERRAGEMIFMIFCFVFLLFIASDRAAFLYLSVFTVSHFFF